MGETKTFSQLNYEIAAPNVARIIMNRPERLNAQGMTMTYEIDAAFRLASGDPSVHVIILAGAGKHFNAGHDLSGEGPAAPEESQKIGLWGPFEGAGWEGAYAREKEIYLEITERWRNAPKPTIAEVQGAVVAGGNMLVWACDLIVCSDDARFRDNTAAEMAVPGVEFCQHSFELGTRKAKEWLFTGGWLSAREAEQRGMVNRIVPREELSRATLDLASNIAANNPFAMRLAKEAINRSQDFMGRKNAMDFGFALHQIGHMQNMLVHGFPIDISKLHPPVREALEKAIAAGGFRNGKSG
jgi:enoyl-CoA hydratase